jgi:plastocyanin
MTRSPARLLLASLLAGLVALSGCASDDGDGDGDDGPSPSTSASGSVSTTATASPAIATAVEITSAPGSAPAGSKATVCWTVSGTGRAAHVAIHWDDASHASEANRTFQSYNLGASYPDNQTGPAPAGYDLQPTGARFCTAATMPAAGSIFVVAHVIDSTGAPGRLSSEREVEAGASSDASITIANFAYTPPALTVQPGATVTVHNEDSTKHTVTGTGFTTGDVAGGGSGSFTAPLAPGTYPYTCAYHASMQGTLEVV